MVTSTPARPAHLAIDPAAYAAAVLNILEDVGEERQRLSDTQRAVMNIMDDLNAEREQLDKVNSQLREENADSVQELLLRNRDLARSNKDLEEFAYVASHDLQEPLRHISSFVQKLGDRYTEVLDERGRRYMGFVVDGANRMQQLIDGLLEFSRVGRATAEHRRIDLGAVVADAVRDLSGRADQAGAQIEIGPLPVVVGDEDLLYRLFVNLLGNAIKFAHPERQPHIGIASDPGDAGMHVVRVSDNGIGIEPSYRQRAFEIFERLNGDEYAGTGIGLSVARRIIEAHAGEIRLDETAGGGTTVRLELPGASPEASEVPHAT